MSRLAWHELTTTALGEWHANLAGPNTDKERVNNCVGAANYRWFLSLLISLAILLVYGARLAVIILSPRVPDAGTWGGHTGIIGLVERWGYVFARDARVGAIGLLASFMSPLAIGLLAYHIYLLWLGATTNETNKYVTILGTRWLFAY